MQCPTHIKKLEKMTESEDSCEICSRPAEWECKLCKYRQCG